MFSVAKRGLLDCQANEITKTRLRPALKTGGSNPALLPKPLKQRQSTYAKKIFSSNFFRQ